MCKISFSKIEQSVYYKFVVQKYFNKEANFNFFPFKNEKYYYNKNNNNKKEEIKTYQQHSSKWNNYVLVELISGIRIPFSKTEK